MVEEEAAGQTRGDHHLPGHRDLSPTRGALSTIYTVSSVRRLPRLPLIRLMRIVVPRSAGVVIGEWLWR